MAKRAKSSAAGAYPIDEHHSVSVNVRKIANGYVLTHSESGPKGHKSTETYHPKKPDIGRFNIAEPETSAKRLPRDT